MAFRTQKISQMTPKGADLEATDLIEVSTIESGSYVTRSITGQELIDAIPPTTIEWGDIGGTLSNQTDLNTALNGKVPTTRTLTINGVAQDLSADRSWTIATGLTVGTTPIASGTIGRVLFQGTGNVVSQSANLFWDSTNNRLGIGTSTPANPLHLLSATNSAYFAKIQNTNGGALASAGYEMQSNTAYGSLFANPSTYAPYGVLGPSQIGFYTSNTFAIAVDSGGADFRIGVGTGAVERMRVVGSTGNVLINTTTDAGFRLDVNGTARATSYTLGNFIINQASANLFTISNPSGPSGRLDLYGGNTSQANIQIFGSSGGNTNNISFNLGVTNRAVIFGSTGNFAINTTTDAGFRLDVNGTARVSGNLTVLDNNQLGWGNGNYLIANNATPKIDCYVQSSLILTLGQTLFTINVASRTRDLTPSSDNSFDFGGQFGRYRHGWLSGQLKVGDATAVNASAKVQIDSTTQGFLPPRMTTTQKNAIATPATGLMVYDTTLNLMSVYNGTTWITL